MRYTQSAYDILSATTGYYTAMEKAGEIQAKLSELRQLRNSERITEKYYNEQVAPLKKQYSGIQSEARNAATVAINDIRAEYSRRVDSWAMPTPDKKHEDLAVLDGSLSLSAEQLEQLGQKHQNNPVMTGAIRRYAKENKIDVYFSAPTPEGKKTEFDSLCSSALNAIKSDGGISQAVFSDRASFERLACTPNLIDSGE